MQKVDLNKVLEMLINEEQDQATGLLHQWFVEKSKSVHETLMQDDDAVLEDNVSQEIEDDQDEIEAQEHFGESEAEEEVPGEEAGVEMPADDLDTPLDAAPEMAPEDKVEDLEARLEFLKAEFAKITGALDTDQPLDAAPEGEVEMDAPVDDAFDLEAGDDTFAPAEEPKEESLAFEAEEVDEFADLEESFKLEPVADPALNGGKEIGAAGASLSVNNKSPIPQKKGEARVGGAAVEIKAEEHKGYAREAAPEVKARPLLKNQVKKAADDQEPVSKEGDKSAKLNSKDGFGSDSPKSPIGAGAADLRGSDLKRK